MSLVGCSPWGRWGSDTTERLHFHFSLSCIGEGNGNPLQYSCLENPRDGGAWWAVVYGVTQSRTRLKWLSSSSIAFSEYDLSILVCELWVLNVQWLGNIFKAVKEPFLQTEFFKFQNRWLFFFLHSTCHSNFIYSYVEILKSLFYASCGFISAGKQARWYYLPDRRWIW